MFCFNLTPQETGKVPASGYRACQLFPHEVAVEPETQQARYTKRHSLLVFSDAIEVTKVKVPEAREHFGGCSRKDEE